MKDSFNHTDFEKEFFAKTKIHYSKSKEEVWSELDAKLGKTKQAKVIKVNFKKIISYSAAAVLIVSIGIFSFIRYYSINVYCPNGQHSAITLPDGSKVTLNANSQLSYHPYWWKYSRKLDFSGEAFFEVTKGDKFSVVSKNGTTSVLGTSFNIFARDNDYRVHCITGKVKVEKENSGVIILTQNEYTVFD
ncbi:MAG: FecR domain-containing protein [Chloroflexia bacterium]|nr:FecR domain-containing protein [Chloroflexia bacterium]